MNNYIDMKTKTLYFGYGAIDITTMFRTIQFGEITPPMGAGTQIWDIDGDKKGNWRYTNTGMSISLDTLSDVIAISDCIADIEGTRGGTFIFKDVTFDFTMYKRESIELLKFAIEQIRLYILPVIAC